MSVLCCSGFLEASSGSVLIDQMDTHSDMPTIYSIMGVCPQHDLLWENLTAREHLMFYGKLKNLQGSALKTTVEASLKSVNLLSDGVADRQVQSFRCVKKKWAPPSLSTF